MAEAARSADPRVPGQLPINPLKLKFPGNKSIYSGFLSPNELWWLALGQEKGAGFAVYNQAGIKEAELKGSEHLSPSGWSAGSKSIFCEQWEREGYETSIVRQYVPEGAINVLVARAPGVTLGDPVNSPSGKLLAYSRTDWNAKEKRDQSALIVLNLGDRTSNRPSGYYPLDVVNGIQWGGDDSRIYYLGRSYLDGSRGVVSTNLNGDSGERLIVKDATAFKSSPNGHLIAYLGPFSETQHRADLSVVDGNGTKLFSVKKDAFMARMFWSSDSCCVYFSYLIFNKGCEIGCLDCRTGEVSVLVPQSRVGDAIVHLVALSATSLIFESTPRLGEPKLIEVPTPEPRLRP